MKIGRFAELFLIWLLLIGGNYILYTLALPVRIAHQAVVTLVLLLWLWKRGLPQTPLLVPVLAVAGTAGISAVFAIDPRMALENAWGWLIHALLLLWMIDQVRQGRGEKLMSTAVFAGGVIALIGALDGLLLGTSRSGSLFGLVNLAGGFAAALFVPALVRDRTVAVMLIAFVISNQSRGALLAVAVSLVVYVLLERLISRRVLLLGGLHGALVLAAVLLISNQDARRAGDAYRADLWRSALAMTEDDPITGVGPGLFGAAYRGYRERPEDYATGAHNLYLNTFAEMGVLGALASAVVAITFFAYLPARRTRPQNAALAALIGMGTHMLFDHFSATSYTALAALYAAVCIAEVEQPLKLPLRRMARGLALALACFAGWLAVLNVAQVNYEISLETGNVASAQTAHEIDPALKLYALQVERLTGGDLAQLDSTLSESTDTSVYALVSFGRYWR